MDFRILGPLEVVADGHVVALDAAKPRALLAILLLHAGEPVSRDRLIEDLWAGRPPATATKVLQTYVSQLRKAFGSKVIATGPAGYEVILEPDTLDLHRFQRLVAEARATKPLVATRLLEDALMLWRGPPLAEFSYDPWAQPEIGRLLELHLSVLLDRVDADLALGRAGDLVGELEHLVSEHPLSERLRGQLMLALYRSGRQAEALAAYRAARETLVETLGIEPGAALRSLERSILDQDPALEISMTSPEHAASPRSAAPPRVPSSFVGRKQELREILGLLRRGEVRLLTLTGPAGSGKTRLALEATDRLGDEYPDGVVLVELAPISETALLAVAITERLGVGERPGQEPADALVSYLRGRRTLLVLDNFEQLLGGAPLVAELLRAAPGLTMLVTSRSPLDIPEERIYPVPALELPDRSPTALKVGRLRRIEAVRLFVDRAQASRPDFELTDANADAIAEICVHMDGLPLALELAAARTRMLSPSAILQRLGGRLELLKAAPGAGLPERHRTLRAAIEWSYDLLALEEQALFTSLAVFAGGFTLEGAEAVAADLGLDVVVGVETLLNDNLLRAEPIAGGEPRFGMLETIHEYALERLVERGDIDAVRRRHAGFYLSLAEEAGPALLGPQQLRWLERLDAELTDVRAALSWAAESGDVEVGLRIGAALWRFWQLRGSAADGREHLEQLLARRSGSKLARAMAEARIASFANVQGDYEAVRRFGESSLLILRRTADEQEVVCTLSVLCLSALSTGDGDLARDLADECLGVARHTADLSDEAYAAMTAGVVHYHRGELDAAERLLDESVRGARQLGNVRSVANWSRGLGGVALARGDYQRARVLFEESLGIHRSLNDPWGISHSLSMLALVLLGAHEKDAARRLVSESLAIERDVGDLPGQLWNIDALAEIAAADDRPARAARLYACASVVREWLGSRPVEPGWPDLDRHDACLRSVLGEEAFAIAYAEGRAMTLDESLDYALAVATDLEVD